MNKLVGTAFCLLECFPFAGAFRYLVHASYRFVEVSVEGYLAHDPKVVSEGAVRTPMGYLCCRCRRRRQNVGQVQETDLTLTIPEQQQVDPLLEQQ